MKDKKNILVTGMDGQLGLEFKSISNVYPEIRFHFYNSVQLDITNIYQINKVARGPLFFDYCINCAAYTDVEKAEIEPLAALKVNFSGVKNLVDAFVNTKTTLIHISTDYVFDGKKNEAYIESDIPNPINEYGKSKLEGELYILEKSRRYYIIRTSWLYSNFNKNFYKSIVSKISRDETISVTSSQRGAPTTTIELCRAIMHLIKKDEKAYGIFHFSNKGLTNWYIFAKAIIKLINPAKENLLIETKIFKTKATRPVNSKLDSSKFELKFDYKIQQWEDALKQIVKTT